MTKTPLFRQEALNARRDDWLSLPRAIQPLRLRLICWSGAAVTVATLLFLILGSYTHRIRLTGTVTPSEGVVRIFSTVDGRMADLPVQENASVARGDLLFMLDTGAESAEGDIAPRLATELQREEGEILAELARQTELEKASRVSTTENLRMLEQEIVRYEAEILSVAAHVQTLLKERETSVTLMQKGLRTRDDLRQDEDLLMDQQAHLAGLRRQLIERQRERHDLTSRLQTMPLDHASQRGDLRQRLAQLRREIIALEADRTRMKTAPVDGIVTAVLVKPNETVEAYQPVMSLLPESSDMEIHLAAPARAIGFVHKGLPVVLRYTAYPHQKFGQYKGVITSVSQVALPGQESEATTPEFRIIVHPDASEITAYGQPRPLRAGMTVEADILLDRRRLYEWIFAPLYTLRNTLKEEGADQGHAL